MNKAILAAFAVLLLASPAAGRTICGPVWSHPDANGGRELILSEGMCVPEHQFSIAQTTDGLTPWSNIETVKRYPLTVFATEDFKQEIFRMEPGACLRGPLSIGLPNKQQFVLAAGVEYPAGCSEKK